jgi:predicted nucleic acid-binding protein
VIGLDATTLIAFELKEHPLHRKVRNGVRASVASGTSFALADQTLWEFLHVVTDQRRFETPLKMEEALSRANRWLNAREVVRLDSTREAADWSIQWMKDFDLGRKRILDTALAATLHVHGVTRIATANAADFRVFGVFDFEDWALA